MPPSSALRPRAMIVAVVSAALLAVPSLAVADPVSPTPSPATTPATAGPSSTQPSAETTTPSSPADPTPSPEVTPSAQTPSAQTPSTHTPSTQTPSTQTPSTGTPGSPTPQPSTVAPTPDPIPSSEVPSSQAPAQKPSSGPESSGPERRSIPKPEVDSEPEILLSASSSSPIAVRYRQSGGASGPLGRATVAERSVSGGRYARFANGAIYYSTATGAKIVWNDEMAAFLEVGGLGRMGFPRFERDCRISGGGCAQTFTAGVVMRHPASGTHAVLGAINGRYLLDRKDGWVLGYPLDRERCGLRDGGCYQKFDHGGIYWTPAYGTRLVATAFYRTWSSLTWERGPLGYPTGERRCGLADGGCYQTFERGNLYYTSKIGMQASWGAIFRSWGASSFERGPLGYPIGPEYCGQVGGGCFQNFQGGRVLYSPAGGTHRVHGAIRGVYAAEGWHPGRLGYPKTDQNCSLSSGGCVQEFTGGAVYYSPGRGAHAMFGSILGTWRRNGAQDGVMKYPVGAQSCSSSTACRQSFENGVISVSNGTGRLEIRGIQAKVRSTTASDVRHTYRSGCPVPPSRLRTIEMNYWGYDGRIRRGVLIVRDSVASGVVAAFAEAYGKRWPIARMDNPNLWQGDDPRMMSANLTSGFNCRQVVGNPYAVSPHSYGTAIDTNTVQNPYRDRNGTWWPSNGKGYILGAVLNRERIHPGVHTTSTPFVQAIEKRGWFWGGRWSPGRDYHHFEYRG